MNTPATISPHAPPSALLTERRTDGWSCTYFSAAAAQQMKALGSDWLYPSLAGAELIKENQVRRVYRIRSGGAPGGIIVKHQTLRGLPAYVALFRGDPATRESHAALYARSRHVPAAEPLAMAVRRRHAGLVETATAFAEIEDARPLSEAFRALASPTDLDNLSRLIAGLLAGGHAAGFLHPDNHPGNILVRRDDDGLRCWYVDVLGARCGRPVTDRDAAQSLAHLQQWFLPRTTARQRLSFLKQYTAVRGFAGSQAVKRLARLINAIAIPHAFALYAQRDRRIGGNNRWYERVRDGDVIRVRPRRWREPAGAQLAGESAEPASVEQFIPRSHPAAWIWRIFGSPAWRRFCGAARAMHRDIPVALPQSWEFHQQPGGMPVESWTALRPAGGQALARWFSSARGRRRAGGIEAAAALLADTLTRGLMIRNLSLDRLEIAELPVGPRVYWSGIEAGTLRRPASDAMAHWTLQHLRALAPRELGASRSDLARYLRAFCRRRGGHWRAWWLALMPDSR